MSTLSRNIGSLDVSYQGSLARPLPASRTRNLSTARVPFRQHRKYRISLIAALVGLGSSTYVAMASSGMTDVVGCGGAVVNCSSVLNSRWSAWFGIPVAWLAVGLYCVLFAALLALPFGTSARTKAVLLRIWTVLGIMAGAAAIWFVSLQAIALGKFCTWCLVAHSAGLVLGAVSVFCTPLRSASKIPLAGLAAAGLIVLVLGQLASPIPLSYRIEVPAVQQRGGVEVEQFDAPDADAGKPVPRRNTWPETNQSSLLLMNSAPVICVSCLWAGHGSPSLHAAEKQDKQLDDQEELKVVFSSPVTGKQTSLTVGDWPHVGDRSSPKQFIEMIDYTCPHCRAMHKVLHEACLGDTENDPPSYGITVLVVPMNSRCNAEVKQDSPHHQDACELAALALAVWRAEPEKFAAFHDWLMRDANAPQVAAARAEASRLVSEESIRKHLADGLVSQYLQKTSQLYALAGGGTVPKILFEQQAVVGHLPSADEFRNILQSVYPDTGR